MNFGRAKREMGHLKEKYEREKGAIINEERVKDALIKPLFRLVLGYDPASTSEFRAEYGAGHGRSKDKVDYAVFINNKPAMIIECKDFKQELVKHAKQLSYYFDNAEARIAILSNGLEYLFYSDFAKINKMDEEPFFTFDIRKHSDEDIRELLFFSRNNFDLDQVRKRGEEKRLKKQKQENEKRKKSNVNSAIVEELLNPSDPFICLLISRFHEGRIGKTIRSEYDNVIKGECRLVYDAINRESGNQGGKTTREELWAYQIVKTILIHKGKYDIGDISYQDYKSHFTIRLGKGKRGNEVCRLYFNYLSDLKIAFGEKGVIKPGSELRLASIDEINKHSNKLVKAAREITDQSQSPISKAA